MLDFKCQTLVGLSCSDPQLKEIIKHIDELQPSSDHFIIAELGDSQLFIKAIHLELVLRKVKEHQDKLHYEAPKE
jgi:hypothetical protein